MIWGHHLRQPEKKLKMKQEPPVVVARGSRFSSAVWESAVILVDKPQDWTSFDVCGKLRGALKVKKVRQFHATLARACP
jgi:hypothetical protein